METFGGISKIIKLYSSNVYNSIYIKLFKKGGRKKGGARNMTD